MKYTVTNDPTLNAHTEKRLHPQKYTQHSGIQSCTHPPHQGRTHTHTLCLVSAFSVSPSLPAATVLILTLYSLDVNLSLNTNASDSATSCTQHRGLSLVPMVLREPVTALDYTAARPPTPVLTRQPSAQAVQVAYCTGCILHRLHAYYLCGPQLRPAKCTQGAPTAD